MLAAFLLAALSVPTPAPPETPLKQIIRVTSRPLCSAIRDRIGPSVAALLQNDDAIANGTHYIFEMGRDEGRPWMQIDKLRLENDVSKIVENLEAVDRLLQARPQDAAADGTDRATVDRLEANLRKAADAQRAELNVLDGTLESEEMAELTNSDLPSSLTASGFSIGKLGGDEIASDTVADTAAPAPSPAPSPGDDGGVAEIRSRKVLPALAGPAATAPESANVYSKLGVAALAGMRSTAAAESQFTQALLPAAVQCQRLTAPPTR